MPNLQSYEYQPPTSLLEKNQFGPGGAGSFKKVKSKPQANPFDITGVSGDELFNQYGIDPKTLAKEFDTSFQQGQGAFSPFEDKASEGRGLLREQYGNVGEAFDVTETIKALTSARSANLTAGSQAAATAANRFLESSIPGSSSGTGATLIRAQALLPFLQADFEAATKQTGYADEARRGALSASADIAAKLAQLQQQYTESLAGYNAERAKFGLQFAQGKQALALESSLKGSENKLDLMKTMLQLQQSEKESQRAAELQRQQLTQQATSSRDQNRLTAAQLIQQMQAPVGSYQTDQFGNVVGGNEVFRQLKDYQQQQAGATGILSNYLG